MVWSLYRENAQLCFSNSKSDQYSESEKHKEREQTEERRKHHTRGFSPWMNFSSGFLATDPFYIFFFLYKFISVFLHPDLLHASSDVPQKWDHAIFVPCCIRATKYWNEIIMPSVSSPSRLFSQNLKDGSCVDCVAVFIFMEWKQFFFLNQSLQLYVPRVWCL